MRVKDINEQGVNIWILDWGKLFLSTARVQVFCKKVVIFFHLIFFPILQIVIAGGDDTLLTDYL